MTAPAVNIKNQQGWIARLELEYGSGPGRTLLTRNHHQGPMVVQKPLYPEGTVCHTCLLHPPGGVVGGDRLEIEILAGKGSKALLTTPGATKFYRSQGAKAVQEHRLIVRDLAMLEWLPQDTIIFPGSNAVMDTRVDLAPSARFIGWKILCLGLPVNGKRFSEGYLQSMLAMYRDNVPIFFDRLKIEGEQDLDSVAGLRGFPVVANFIATCDQENMLPLLRDLMPQEPAALYGFTQVDGLIIARYLGYSTFAARALLIEAWKLLRPAVAGLDACIPRIWMT